jgi:hypothetical protein
MSTAKRLGLIALGYALAVAGGCAVVTVNELLMPAEISATSGGMVAFGDMILFVLTSGFFGLVPTWFLLKLCVEKAPGAVLAVVLGTAVLGPVSWLAVRQMAGGPPASDQPQATWALAGLLLAFVAIPRIVAGPVLVVIEAVTVVLVRARVARALLAAAMLLDIVPLTMFVLHMAPHYLTAR